MVQAYVKLLQESYWKIDKLSNGYLMDFRQTHSVKNFSTDVSVAVINLSKNMNVNIAIL